MCKSYLRLTGGLGNQLFQLAFGLGLDRPLVIIHFDELNSEISSILRSNEFKDLDITVVNISKSIIIKKILNLSLRLSTLNGGRYLRNACGAIAGMVLSFKFHHRMKVQIASGTGELNKNDLLQKGKSVLRIGYFQAEKYARNFKNIYKSSNLNGFSFNEFKELAALDKPIMVQIRLGDYHQNPRLGIPSINYFKSALSKITSQNQGKIWLFSNDPLGAKIILNEAGVKDFRIIDNSSLTDWESIQLLNLGTGFVISNSTFGWWGAYLRHNLDAQVICPDPWFSSVESPQGLIPEGWSRENSRFGELRK